MKIQSTQFGKRFRQKYPVKRKEIRRRRRRRKKWRKSRVSGSNHHSKGRGPARTDLLTCCRRLSRFCHHHHGNCHRCIGPQICSRRYLSPANISLRVFFSLALLLFPIDCWYVHSLMKVAAIFPHSLVFHFFFLI